MKRKAVLTIAGSDSSGGAGIQADLKTMLACGVYGMSAVTALTAQNTQGVTAIMEASPEFLQAELDAVFSDIPPEAVKIGMVASVPLIETIAEALKKYEAKHVVVDPVMVATSGARLINEDAVATLEKLFALAEIITPNLPELSLLVGREITTRAEMKEAAKELHQRYGCAVLAKGGHLTEGADDYLVLEWGGFWLKSSRIDTTNTHGTGCTLSSAIASYLALGQPLDDAVPNAKDYLTGALSAGLDLGQGCGPMDHGWRIFQTIVND